MSETRADGTHFSFTDHKNTYEALLYTSNGRQAIVEDTKDLWRFIVKYENMLKRMGVTSPQDPLCDQDYHKLTPYHKMKTVPLSLNLELSGEDQAPSGRSQGRKLNYKERQFYEIVLIYLDFKQKEKFAKIKKLRKSQKSLPMWQFKGQLAQALNESQVLIIAGDTGCGKSTQVPQYLHEFGYRSIGELK